jgi:hypothetical protein
MIYSKNWLVLHIPRTGGSNFKANALQNNSEAIMPFSVVKLPSFMEVHNPAKYFLDYMVNRKTYAVVRNPYDRAFSMYCKFTQDPRISRIIGKPTFKDFFDVQLKDINWHFGITQKAMLDCDMPIHIVRFENLKELYEETNVPMLNRNKRNSIFVDNSLYTDANMKHIEDIFYDDFVEFNYKRK